jgi:hypothetical protein
VNELRPTPQLALHAVSQAEVDQYELVRRKLGRNFKLHQHVCAGLRGLCVVFRGEIQSP